MKKEWKPEELRETSEEIRGATLAKSITPEMVGGTLSGLTEALAEVVDVLGEIPREHVTVKVRGYDGTGGVSGAGATVWLDVFNTKGYPAVSIPRQELTCNENGVVEFDIPHGFKYAVFSQLDGLGASFQLVFQSAVPERHITLWNLPIGVWALGHTDMAHYANSEDPEDTGEWYYAVPFVTNTFLDEIPEEVYAWDVDEEKGFNTEGGWYIGILVSTADTSFAIGRNSKSKDSMVWCDSEDYFTHIPGFNYFVENDNMPYDYNAAEEAARQDLDGHLNTAKILSYSPTHISARFCANQLCDLDERRFLPSAGQLCLMQLNRTAINALMKADADLGNEGFELLPYQNDKGQWQNPSNDGWWWSSTPLSCRCSWVVYYYGIIRYNYRNISYDVRAVSAFHFEY
nr:MAG TPA: Protein of unknown function (DUF1566) [Caudoviricetes sp.]